MNLSLEADLLPKTHAGGGEADIVWKYEMTYEYPKHTLLIEATLADGQKSKKNGNGASIKTFGRLLFGTS